MGNACCGAEREKVDKTTGDIVSKINSHRS